MQSQERRVPSLFTLTFIQAILGVLFFVALVGHQRDLTILSFLVLCILGGTRLWAQSSLSNLNCFWSVGRSSSFPGEKITLSLTAENAKLLPIWLEIEIPVGNLIRSSSAEKVLTKEFSLLSYERVHSQWHICAERRGVFEVGPLELHSGDFFSFFRRHRRTADSRTIVVYPRLVALRAFPLPRRDFFGAPRASSPVQDPIYILGTRDYQHRQPSKYIHWKASARHDHLQEKVFEPTTQERILLAVDVSAFAEHHAEEEFERALETAASLGARLVRQGHSVGLVTNGEVYGRTPGMVPLGRDPKQLSSILEVLARLGLRTLHDLRNSLRASLASSWGASCVYFAYQDGEELAWAKEYFSACLVPANFFVSQPIVEDQVQPRRDRRRVYRIGDLLASRDA